MNAEDSHFIESFLNSPAEEILAHFLAKFQGKAAFSTGMGAEDQVITHMIHSLAKNAFIFTLDTGRLFPETYDLIQATEARYGIQIHLHFPDSLKVEEMVREKGINLFYDSVENRKLCCDIRKTDSLKRALQGKQVWISGLRREQSYTRKDTVTVAWDEQYSLYKVNPLAHWTSDQVWDYIRQHRIPYNPLHDKGFPSIGCQPCTRAVEPGEDLRAGRWWWEMDGHRECGIHRK
ncbi:MAG: phosphoadenylyl-sulfate reductase [Lentimicrobiaceae bacterium]|nr:phosphoadenylyl-sulfate reductase [Lentimicrobiaceae bacterium]